jgi:predicted secreted Zn-dependent protease
MGASTRLPRWVGYDRACSSAQTEWDRFLAQVRTHEQAAHIDAARAFVDKLGTEETVITDATVDEVRDNLTAKQADLADRLQAIHDACTHGYDIDAILHPDNGGCSD